MENIINLKAFSIVAFGLFLAVALTSGTAFANGNSGNSQAEVSTETKTVELLDAGQPTGVLAECTYRIVNVRDGANVVNHTWCEVVGETEEGALEEFGYQVGDVLGPFNYQFSDGCWNVLVVAGYGNLHNQVNCN